MLPSTNCFTANTSLRNTPSNCPANEHTQISDNSEIWTVAQSSSPPSPSSSYNDSSLSEEWHQKSSPRSLLANTDKCKSSIRGIHSNPKKGLSSKSSSVQASLRIITKTFSTQRCTPSSLSTQPSNQHRRYFCNPSSSHWTYVRFYLFLLSLSYVGTMCSCSAAILDQKSVQVESNSLFRNLQASVRTPRNSFLNSGKIFLC